MKLILKSKRKLAKYEEYEKLIYLSAEFNTNGSKRELIDRRYIESFSEYAISQSKHSWATNGFPLKRMSLWTWNCKRNRARFVRDNSFWVS